MAGRKTNPNHVGAPKGNKRSRGNRGGGRKELYKEEFAEIAGNLTKLDKEITDDQLGMIFGVAPPTIRLWKKRYPDFAAAVKEGKELADAKVVASLYHRARGYSHPDVHITNYQGKVTKTNITKHYPPDPTSCIFWLKNRQREKWPNKDGVDYTPPNAEESGRVIRSVVAAMFPKKEGG